MKTEIECEDMAVEYLQAYTEQCQVGTRQELLNAIAKMVAVSMRAYEVVDKGKMEVVGPRRSTEKH